MISEWYKAKIGLVLCHQLLLKLSKVRGNRNKKALFWNNCYLFQILKTFGNLGIDFGINLKELRNYNQRRV